MPRKKKVATPEPIKREIIVIKKETQEELSQDDKLDYVPMLGEKCFYKGDVIAITSFEPLEAIVYRREDGVQTATPYLIDSLADIESLSKEDLYKLIY